MVKNQMALSMPTDLSTIPEMCEHCILGKQTKTPVPYTWEGMKSKGLLDKVFSDTTGLEDVSAAVNHMLSTLYMMHPERHGYTSL